MYRYVIRINDGPDTWLWWSCNIEHGAGWTDKVSERNAFTMDELTCQIRIIEECANGHFPPLTIMQVREVSDA